MTASAIVLPRSSVIEFMIASIVETRHVPLANALVTASREMPEAVAIWW